MTFAEADALARALATEMVKAGYGGIPCYDCGTTFNARDIACNRCCRPVCLDCWMRRHNRGDQPCLLPDTTDEVTT